MKNYITPKIEKILLYFLCFFLMALGLKIFVASIPVSPFLSVSFPLFLIGLFIILLSLPLMASFQSKWYLENRTGQKQTWILIPKKWSNGKLYHFEVARHWKTKNISAFIFCMQFGNGGGYLNGFSVYMAWNSGSRRWAINNRGLKSWNPLEMGITRGGNTPYISH